MRRQSKQHRPRLRPDVARALRGLAEVRGVAVDLIVDLALRAYLVSQPAAQAAEPAPPDDDADEAAWRRVHARKSAEAVIREKAMGARV
jgi:hypothetical protein